MFSIAASGTLANTAVFSTWKGRPYVRNRVIPANPKTASQTGMRQLLRGISQAWNALQDAAKNSWKDLADQKQISTFNAYIGKNGERWRNGEYPSQAYPAAEDDQAAALGSASGQAVGRNAEVTIATTTLNQGWLIFLHRSTQSGFTPGFSTLVAVKPHDGTNDVVFEDGPLDSGTYYYKAVSGSAAGVAGTPSNEVSVEIS